MYHPSGSNYKSWASRSGAQSVPPYPTTSPGPMPGAPHLRTVSLPHPNATLDHTWSSSGYSPYEGPSRILSLNALLSCEWMAHRDIPPPMYYNVTRDVQYIQYRPGSSNLLSRPAVEPACTVMVLSVPLLPLWSTIEVQNPHGVTVHDVLARIRSVLDRSVSQSEMSAMGVKRIDFLGPNVYFAGLSRSMDGHQWEVRFTPSLRAYQ